MGNIKKTKLFKEMRTIIALVVLIAISSIAAQAPVATKKWMCCTTNGMSEPQCPKKLKAPSRILQQVEVKHPEAPNCTNFNGSRRLQAVVTLKCPVNVEGIQCFKNNTNAACKQP